MKIKTVLWGLATAALLVSCSGAKLSVANEQYARGEFYDAAQTCLLYTSDAADE